MKTVFISSECTPFIKTGGLADVTGSLPKALAKQGAEVSVIIPKYSMIPEEYRNNMEHVLDFRVSMGWRQQYVGAEKLILDGVTYYFADNEYYFKQNYVYAAGDFETERFCWFCRASLEIMARLDIVPDIIHLNDWQTGLIPMLIKEQYLGDPRFNRVRTVYTIHNLRYQGLMNPMLVNDMLGLGQDALAKAEYYSNVNAVKAGIVYSDIVNTVSPSYADEIRTPEYGETLDGLMRTRDIRGIMNGIDTAAFNPRTDKSLPARFSKNSMTGKKKCKLALQRELGLGEDADAPVAALISRLTNQKGLDLFEMIIPGLLDLGVQIAVLGMGDRHFEMHFAYLQSAHPGAFAFRAEMNDALARRIYAGSDLFLMPSAFEPCGLSQLYALRYGSLPVVRETGGLRDSIIPYNRYTGEGNGFSFGNYSADEFYHAVKTAAELYRNDRAAFDTLVHAAMSCDFSWKRSAREYMKLYKELCAGRD